MAASALERGSRQVDNIVGSNLCDSDSANSNSPTIYVKSGKPSSRLRQSQSASNLQIRAQSAYGSESSVQNRNDHLYPGNSAKLFPFSVPHTQQQLICARSSESADDSAILALLDSRQWRLRSDFASPAATFNLVSWRPNLAQSNSAHTSEALPMLERTSLLSNASPPHSHHEHQPEASSSSTHSGSSQPAIQPPPRRGAAGYSTSVASFSSRSNPAPPIGFSSQISAGHTSSSENYFSLGPVAEKPGASCYSAYELTNAEGGGAAGGNGIIPPESFHPYSRHRGELSILEKYRYDLSRAQLKASSRTSALLAGFAMVALVELQYESTTPPSLLIILGVVTTLLVSVHLLALMMSTCILPYIEANGCTQDSPHIRLKFYIDLSWIFSTCIGLVLFLIEIGVIFFVKFNAVGYDYIGYITTAMLAPVLVVFIVFSCLIHRNRFSHSMDRVDSKVVDLQKFLTEADAHNLSSSSSVHKNIVGASLQGITVVKSK